MGNNFSFAVGCFHIGTNPSEPLIETNEYMKGYSKRVKKFLSSYSNIKQIDIGDYSSFRLLRHQNEVDKDELNCLNDADGIFPWPVSTYCQFVIDIPKRHHLEYFHFDEPLEAEQFLVRIVYDYELPIVLVRSIDSDISDPTDMIILVREFFKNKPSNSEGLCLQWLGPSPFHCNFKVEYSDSISEIGWSVDTMPGYDEAIVMVPEEKGVKSGANDDELWQYIGWKLAREIGLYYSIVQNKNRLWGREDELRIELDELIKSKKKSLKTKLPRFFNGKRVHVLAIDTLQLSTDVDELEKTSMQKADKIEKEYGEFDFKTCISEEIKGLTSHKPDDIIRILEILRGYTSELSTNVLIVVGSMLGLMGVVLGSLLSG